MTVDRAHDDGWAALADGRWAEARALFQRALVDATAPARVQAPLLWGDEANVRSLFGDGVASLALERRTYVERSASAEAYGRLFEETFGPVIALRAAHAGDSERAAALDADLATFAESANLGPPGEPARYVYEYLLVVARKR